MVGAVSTDKDKTKYSAAFICAVLLHVIIFGLLIGSVFFYRPSQYAVQQQAVQANLVSSSQLAAMMAKSAPSPAAKVAPAPAPAPVKKVEPPVPAPKPTPVKPVEKPAVKPIVKSTPTPVAKAIPVQPKAAEKPKPVTKPAPQKSLEESMLESELNTTPTKAKPSKSKQQALLDQQLLAEEGTVQAKAASAQQAAARSAATEGEIDKYKALILQQIQQNWIMPQNVQNLSCVLQVELAPGGMVLNVKLVKSSGNDALDRSAIAAVNKASPLPVPKDSAAFAAFRNFTLTVKPDGSELAES